ncbi:acyl-CoA synthetase (AMP-forming)/AMP-acid ligase II [Mycolicibacterium phlei]|uniref:O-succinylbenzoic acid--CoA ligase n=1 Tax=Mycolicibacterium phlei DSM 43239 = CCUG 21000 TaxID=1226750 RepID=A0A5N5VDS1_MYCPH|nr:o-succinylbenzoate--CoA ligase [Mycolicibacterium phlei]VEG11325.1 acyl-CoA synthetase (AMP-forming)/AMP-acid ligase II [Mycobacteroides chelonae]AMO63228.1 Long-chain-fatty-acid--CoA ligase [Mycolicibacterium phlei]KAB7759906.1 O-succinylbenzoic acid--CoA ligase [Mycolicibacterium phlei DSM 43239 = CCUG 21000]KXW64273.1 O-succinylbenzoic acid--CoA ligase [Mycolicibacterium phlei DSM 43072]KXW68953.1 O-succinylbenzoic acid--CoA ligase [Mycolicibacterium phlei DSM 43239 = CCUG 21000]
MSVLRPVAVGSGAAALALLPVVADLLAGRAHVLPVPADDEREAALLTTALRAGEPIDDDVAVVVSTSGTTGTPKGAMLTAAALTASATATYTRLGGPGRWLLALAAHHVAGLQVLVRSVVAGTEPVAVSPSFSAAELVSSVSSLGSGRRYASLVAVQLDKALRDPEATAALASLDAVLIGGGPLPAGVAEKAAAAGIPVVRTYGMSETAGGCVYDGLPLDGVRVRIDDGRVVLGGPTVAKGYRNPVTPDPFAELGWFRTDDVGTVDDSGRLTVLGRADDAISTGGLTVMPHLVESAIGTHEAVAECAVFGVPDERLGQRVVAAVVVAPGHDAPTVADLRAHVGARMDTTAAPREIHVVDELPRRGIGKLDRRALTARFTP